MKTIPEAFDLTSSNLRRRKRRRVLLYGKSLVLGTVGVSLRHYSHLEIVSLSPPLPPVSELGALAPDVIVFDLEAAQPQSAMSLLEGRPSLLLIGIDPGGDQTLFWSGQQSSTVTMQDLVQAINALPDSDSVPSRPREKDLVERRGTGRRVQSWARMGFARLEQTFQFTRFNLGLSRRATRILAVAVALVVLAVAGLLAAGQNNLGQLLGFGR